MALRKTRQAKKELRKRFQTGTEATRSPKLVALRLRPKRKGVVVGKEFTVTIDTEPKIDGFAYATVAAGTPYRYHTRRLEPGEVTDTPFLCHGIGTVGYPIGVLPHSYGITRVSKGTGTLKVTQYTREAFALKVRVGKTQEILAFRQEQVRYPTGARRFV